MISPVTLDRPRDESASGDLLPLISRLVNLLFSSFSSVFISGFFIMGIGGVGGVISSVGGNFCTGEVVMDLIDIWRIMAATGSNFLTSLSFNGLSIDTTVGITSFKDGGDCMEIDDVLKQTIDFFFFRFLLGGVVIDILLFFLFDFVFDRYDRFIFIFFWHFNYAIFRFCTFVWWYTY